MMSKGQLGANVALETAAIGELQIRLKDSSLSRKVRDELERELIQRGQIRYIAVNSWKRMRK